MEEFTKNASDFAEATVGLQRTDFLEKMQRDIEATTTSLQRERGEIGLSGAALQTYRLETELLARAKQANMDKDPAVIANIRATAAAQGVLIDQIDKLRKAQDTAKETSSRFFGDLADGIDEGKNSGKSFVDAFAGINDYTNTFVTSMRRSLDEGQSRWESFGNAVVDTLERLKFKLMDKVLQNAIDNLFSGNKSGGIIGAITGLFGGGKGGAVAAPTKAVFPNALGGVYGPGGRIEKYAKGGVVHGATMFNSASGPGVMGEAGPEAIMPLKRGPNGALGVVANDNGSRGPAQITIEGNTYVIQGSSTADMQREVQRSAEQTLDRVRTQVPAILAEYQMNGAVV